MVRAWGAGAWGLGSVGGLNTACAVCTLCFLRDTPCMHSGSGGGSGLHVAVVAEGERRTSRQEEEAEEAQTLLSAEM